jgi:hypothetical protein
VRVVRGETKWSNKKRGSEVQALELRLQNKVRVENDIREQISAIEQRVIDTNAEKQQS